MESSSRMRRLLRRNYQGSDHHGAAANYEDHMHLKHDKDTDVNPSNASTLAAEAISTEVEVEEDEHDASYLNVGTNGDHSGETPSASRPAEQSQMASESTDPPVGNDLDSAHISTAVAPGYVPSEQDERIVFELQSSMVCPLKVVRGTFQVSSTDHNQYLCLYFVGIMHTAIGFPCKVTYLSLF